MRLAVVLLLVLGASKVEDRPALRPYGAQVEQQPKPIPWLAMGLGAIAVLVALPFALRAYRSTAAELKNS